MVRFSSLIACLTLSLLPNTAFAQRFIWVEAESVAVTHPLTVMIPRVASDVLSAGKQLRLEWERHHVPAEGVTFTIPLAVEQFGEFDLWARVAHPSARSPFRWRIDTQDWHDVSPETRGVDLMATGTVGDIVWLQLGRVKLPAGTRNLELHLPRPSQGKLQFAIDCVVASRGPFTPNGKHKPGLDWRSTADRAAEAVVFELPERKPNSSRIELDLGGSWQTARWDRISPETDLQPLDRLPDLKSLHWRAVRVPGRRIDECPDWVFCHRQLYRCRVKIPASPGNTRFQLSFPGNALVSTAFVNEKRVGHSDLPLVPLVCDLTTAIRPGEINEIVVVIEDWHAALADRKLAERLAHLPMSGVLKTRPALAFPVPSSLATGILQTPMLLAISEAKISLSQVFPDIAKREVTAALELTNLSDFEVNAVVRNRILSPTGVETLLIFPDTLVSLPARSSIRPRFQQAWENAWIWSLHHPQSCLLETTLLVNDQPFDQIRTPFGLAQWTAQGNRMLLNSKPVRLRSIRNPLAEITFPGNKDLVPGSNLVFCRGLVTDSELTTCDQRGVAVLRADYWDEPTNPQQLLVEGAINRPLFDRWRRQLAAQVTAERHHPSIAAWIIGSGLPGADSMPANLRGAIEPEIRKALEIVKEIDPNRVVVIAGSGGAWLPELPAQHHVFEYESRMESPRDRTVIASVRIATPDSAGAVVGVAGMALALRLQSQLALERLRWEEVAAFEIQTPLFDSRWLQPVVVLCKDHNPILHAGKMTRRTLKVCNDSLESADFNVHWLLLPRNVQEPQEFRGKKVISLGPGESREFPIELLIPDQPSQAWFVLTCDHNGREIFRSVRFSEITR